MGYLKRFWLKKRKHGVQLAKKLKVDIHAHWLPGIDDGANTLDDSLSILKGLQNLGFEKAIATPHINCSTFPNQPDDLIKCYYNVCQAVADSDLNIKLGLAAEYQLDDGFRNHLLQETLLTLNEKYLLIELPSYYLGNELKKFIFEIQIAGYIPVIAHPERYHYYKDQLDLCRELHEIGCMFQGNMLSFYGSYGKKIQRSARQILANGWMDFLATDIHTPPQLSVLSQVTVDGNFSNDTLL